MATKDSNYYKNQMNSYSKEKNALDSSIKEYEDYLEKLEKLSKKITNIADDTAEASQLLSSGGYVFGGDIPMKDDFLFGSKKLDSGIKGISDAIKNTKNAISKMKTQSAQLSSDIRSAESNYNKCLIEEKG